jgi:hypothetical protein
VGLGYAGWLQKNGYGTRPTRLSRLIDTALIDRFALIAVTRGPNEIDQTKRTTRINGSGMAPDNAGSTRYYRDPIATLGIVACTVDELDQISHEPIRLSLHVDRRQVEPYV